MDTLLNALELFWVLGALLGMAISAQALREALEDARYLAARGLNSTRRIAARAAIRRARLQLLTLGFFALTGLVVLTRPWLDVLGVPPAVIGTGIRLVVCVAIGQIIVVALLDRRDRDCLLHHLERED